MYSSIVIVRCSTGIWCVRSRKGSEHLQRCREMSVQFYNIANIENAPHLFSWW